MTIERLSGRKRQQMRERVWLKDPCCARCRIVLPFTSTGFDLDHIVALTNGGTNDESNFQVLCPTCHEDKTNEDLGYTPKVTTGADGWPVEEAAPGSVTRRTARWKRAARG